MNKPSHIQDIPSQQDALIKSSEIKTAQERDKLRKNDSAFSIAINKAINDGEFYITRKYMISNEFITYLRKLGYTVETDSIGIIVRWKITLQFDIKTLYSETKEL